jgi:hypothetical protein
MGNVTTVENAKTEKTHGMYEGQSPFAARSSSTARIVQGRYVEVLVIWSSGGIACNLALISS